MIKKCPLRKSINYSFNSDGKTEKETPWSSSEDFMNCIEEECEAWNDNVKHCNFLNAIILR